MVFPIIPILAIAAILAGSGVLAWYKRLTPEEREDADREANRIAGEMFGKALNELTSGEAKQVMKETKKQLE